MADSKKYNGSTWEHSLRKLATATDTFTSLPVDVYADGNTATVGLKGNTVQNGTPTSDNPIMPQGCGDLETVGAKAGQYKIPLSSANTTTPIYLGEVETTRRVKKLVLTGEESFEAANSCFIFWLYSMSYPNPKQELIYCTHYQGRTPTYRDSLTDGQCMVTINQNQIAIKDLKYATIADFKAYLAAQYAAGTPVTIWYVLATETTGIVNEPLMKIGDYADEVSGITIPTITGKDTFDVETTLKPSEASLNYTGWHDSSVKEWDGSQWNQ